MAQSDSTNLIQVKQIMEQHGWFGTDVVGKTGNKIVWLVIQHDLVTQLKYVPLLRKSVEQGKSRPYYLALMVDRIALKHGKKQIYGSQYQRDPETGVFPYRDPPHDTSK